MPFKSEKQRRWMHANHPEMAKRWEKKKKMKKETKVKSLIKKMVGEIMSEEKLTEKAKRDYKAEYKKYGSSTKAKKYRAELNAYNRKKGTYGNGDGKDASHKGGKIVGFEKESVNRGRAEKSRLKKEEKLKEGVKFSSSQINQLVKAFKNVKGDVLPKNHPLMTQVTKLLKQTDKKTLQQIKSADIPYLSVIALDLLNEAKLSEQITSFNAIQDKLVDLGFGDMKISWRGTKKKIKDFKPGKRLDNITLEKTHNTLLKKNLIRYDGNSYNVTVNGQKNFKSTLQLEGKLTEAIQPSKAITKVLDMADGGYGKLGGKIVDGLSANLFKTVYNKANDTNKEKMNKMNEKQLYVFLTKLWSKFGRQVKI
tara:strand:- start:355 stop:1452 length:1098 start_codon:yes stop_codon:yes gene_type:complete